MISIIQEVKTKEIFKWWSISQRIHRRWVPLTFSSITNGNSIDAQIESVFVLFPLFFSVFLCDRINEARISHLNVSFLENSSRDGNRISVRCEIERRRRFFRQTFEGLMSRIASFLSGAKDQFSFIEIHRWIFKGHQGNRCEPRGTFDSSLCLWRQNWDETGKQRERKPGDEDRRRENKVSLPVLLLLLLPSFLYFSVRIFCQISAMVGWLIVTLTRLNLVRS